MMKQQDVILKVENLSKQYRLGVVGTGTISHDLNRFLTKVTGKEDPYLKIGESNDRSTKGTSEYVWALKDINFEVKRGEILGIIGKNGAGKSTLLKILSKVTGPTTGSIKYNGRIASLLEVGTGFHPEMTGRENIFLNGAILGMTKKEISRKLDEIIEFSGCERYVDTPVKRYSSGMKVRLAFAVAAFLEPDILVIDEVLAVGDAEFQKKAIGKMQDISSQAGRTVFFVSHDMGAIQGLCSRLMVIANGENRFIGDVNSGIEYYLSNRMKISSNFKNDSIELLDFSFIINENKVNVFRVCEAIKIRGSIEYLTSNLPKDLKIEIFIKDSFGQVLTTISSWLNGINYTPELNINQFEIYLPNGINLNIGEYYLDIHFYDIKSNYFVDVKKIELISNPNTGYKFPLKPKHGKIFTPNEWKIK